MIFLDHLLLNNCLLYYLNNIYSIFNKFFLNNRKVVLLGKELVRLLKGGYGVSLFHTYLYHHFVYFVKFGDYA